MNTDKQTPKNNDKNKKPAEVSGVQRKAGSAENQGDGVGEGNRAATERYNAGVAQSEARGKSDELAAKAKKALDGPEAAELEAAEKKGKAGEPNVSRR